MCSISSSYNEGERVIHGIAPISYEQSVNTKLKFEIFGRLGGSN